MPKSWKLLVKEIIRSFVNLNIAEMLEKYHGPIQLVRRTEDEVICIKYIKFYLTDFIYSFDNFELGLPYINITYF